MGKEDEEEEVSSYRVTLRKSEDTGIWKRKHYKAISVELPLEDVMDLSQNRLCRITIK
jgi:hypothetical protein